MSNEVPAPSSGKPSQAPTSIDEVPAPSSGKPSQAPTSYTEGRVVHGHGKPRAQVSGGAHRNLLRVVGGDQRVSQGAGLLRVGGSAVPWPQSSNRVASMLDVARGAQPQATVTPSNNGGNTGNPNSSTFPLNSSLPLASTFKTAKLSALVSTLKTTTFATSHTEGGDAAVRVVGGAQPHATATPTNNGGNFGISSTHPLGAPTPVHLRPHSMSSAVHPPHNAASSNQNNFQVDEGWVVEPTFLPTSKKAIDTSFATRLYIIEPGLAAHLCGAGKVSQGSPNDADLKTFITALGDLHDYSRQAIQDSLTKELQRLCREYGLSNADGQPCKSIEEVQKVCFTGNLCDDIYLKQFCHFSRVLFENDLRWINAAEDKVKRKFGIKFDNSTPTTKKTFVRNIADFDYKKNTLQKAKRVMTKCTKACFYERAPGQTHLASQFGVSSITKITKKTICVGPHTVNGTLVVLVKVQQTQESAEMIALALTTSSTKEELADKMETIWSRLVSNTRLHFIIWYNLTFTPTFCLYIIYKSQDDRTNVGFQAGDDAPNVDIQVGDDVSNDDFQVGGVDQAGDVDQADDPYAYEDRDQSYLDGEDDDDEELPSDDELKSSDGGSVSNDESSDGNSLSEYEKFRELKVKRNEAKMRELGLGFGIGIPVGGPESLSGKTKPRRKTNKVEEILPARRRSARHAVVCVRPVDHCSLFPTSHCRH